MQLLAYLRQRLTPWLGRRKSKDTGAPDTLREQHARVQHGTGAYSKINFLPWIDEATGETDTRRREYRKMIVRDDAVKGAVFSKLLAVAALDVSVTPDEPDSDIDRQAADFIQTCLMDMDGGVCGLAEDVAAPLIVDGYATNEKVYAPFECGKWARHWFIRRLKPMFPDNYSLQLDEYGNLMKVVGQSFNAGKEWPPTLFTYAKHMPLYDNPRGMSDLAAAYRAYWIKDTAWKLRKEFLNVYARGPYLWGTYATDGQKAQLSAALENAMGAGWTAVPEGVKLELFDLALKGTTDFDSAIEKLDREITTAISGAVLQQMEGAKTGSYNAGAMHGGISDLRVWYLAAILARLLNEQVIPEVLSLNFVGLKGRIRVSFGGINDAELKDALFVDQGLQGMGVRLSEKEMLRKYRRSLPADEGDVLKAPQPPMPEPGLPGMTGLPGSLQFAEWDESEHPRDDDGKFVSGGAISAAKGDAAKEDELRAKVTDPKERKKLDKALGSKSPKDRNDDESSDRRALKKQGKSLDKQAAAIRSKLDDLESAPGAAKGLEQKLKNIRADKADLEAKRAESQAKIAELKKQLKESKGKGEVHQTDKTDESTGLPLNSDGTVTLWHHTSKANADSITKTGKLKSAGEPDVYLTTRKDTDTGYGDTAVPIRVKPSLLNLDDEFPDGRKDFRIDVGKPGGSLKVDVGEPAAKPAKKAPAGGEKPAKGSGRATTSEIAAKVEAAAPIKNIIQHVEPRPGHVYRFVTKDDFQKAIETGNLEPGRSADHGGTVNFSKEPLPIYGGAASSRNRDPNTRVGLLVEVPESAFVDPQTYRGSKDLYLASNHSVPLAAASRVWGYSFDGANGVKIADVTSDVGGKRLDFAEIALTGKPRQSAESALALAQKRSAQTLADICRSAFTRYVKNRGSRKRLFDDEERAKLTEALAVVRSVGRLMGRVRFRGIYERKVEAFAEWDESEHPRGDDGKFISGGDISDAKGDPEKEKALRERVTDPEQRKKLDKELGRSKPARSPEQAAKEWKEMGTKAPAFKAWFGDWEGDKANASKVVDADGTPIVVFHGTGADFDEFKSDNSRQRDGAFLGKGHYFTTHAERAEAYAQNNVVPGGGTPNVKRVYLNIRNPYMAKMGETVPSQEALKKRGYDGVILDMGPEDPFIAKLEGRAHNPQSEWEIVAFEPEQIKSVNNKGTFDPKEKRFNYAEGDLPPRTPNILFGKDASPEKALDYFRGLNPRLGELTPEKFGPFMRREAFTLAVSTEETLLAKVQQAIAQAMEGVEAGAAFPEPTEQVIDGLLEQAGVSPKNSAYSDMVARTNMHDAYLQGSEAERIDVYRDDPEAFPVWRWDAVGDERTRASHLARDGKYYPGNVTFQQVRGDEMAEIANCRCVPVAQDFETWAELQATGAEVESPPW